MGLSAPPQCDTRWITTQYRPTIADVAINLAEVIPSTSGAVASDMPPDGPLPDRSRGDREAIRAAQIQSGDGGVHQPFPGPDHPAVNRAPRWSHSSGVHHARHPQQ